LDKQLQASLFTELMNRYNRFIISVIRTKFEGDDVKDVFQDFSIFIYNKIGTLYEESADLFDSKSWLRTVTNNFCISELRKRNGKRKIKYVSEEKSELARKNYSETTDDFEINIEGDSELLSAINEFLSEIPKRDALILKMKYYYGKPSTYISRKVNETHVDVYIGRLKEKLKKRTGVQNLDEFLAKYHTNI